MLRTAVVGCGLIAAKKYLPLIRRLTPRVKLVAVCDPDEAMRARALVAAPGVAGYADVGSMLEREDVDVAVVCTPPRTHAEIAVRALERGAHVLVEKPMATSSDECDMMLRAATAAGRQVGVMHNQRFNPAFQRALDIVDRGGIGQFVGMRVFLATDIDEMTSNAGHWSHRLPAGVVGETGPHAIYLSLALLRNVTDVEVQALKRRVDYPWSIGEDIRIDVHAENGSSAISLLYASENDAGEVDIWGTKAFLRVDLQSRIVVRYRRRGVAPGTIGTSVVSTLAESAAQLARNVASFAFTRSLDGHARGFTAFLDAVERRQPFAASGAIGREVVALQERIAAKLQKQAEPAGHTVVGA